ncbi:MAG: hypothetical protein JW837_00770 [Sedimentisphaerales bacterium]|nr:hypothetical protein [Sedimentisphaerales bacterium]
MEGVPDEKETKIGGFVPLNDDDDDGDGVIDYDDGYNKDGIAGNDDDQNTLENDLVDVTAYNVLPTSLTDDVTLKYTSGGSNIRIWQYDLPPTEITLPKIYVQQNGLPETVCLEGIAVSSSLRDTTLALQYIHNGKIFDDKIKITVVDLEKICLSSGNAIESPVCFDGTFYLIDTCTQHPTYESQPSLIIPHVNVRTASDPSVIRDFTVVTEAFFLPSLTLTDLPVDIRDVVKWTKISGPDSGYLDDVSLLKAKYKNPKEGGVYEMQFEIPGWDTTKMKGFLHLPLAGPDATAWTLTELAAVLAFGDRLAILEYEFSTGTRIVFFRDGIAWLIASAALDWYGEASQSGSSPCHVFGENETLTISGVVVDRWKFQNMMWGAFTRRVYGTDFEIIKKAAVFASKIGLFSPDTPEAIEAYNAGRDLTDGIPIATVMQNHGYKMQPPGDLAEKLWPSDDPYIGGITRNTMMSMTTPELIQVYIQGVKEEVKKKIEGVFDIFSGGAGSTGEKQVAEQAVQDLTSFWNTGEYQDAKDHIDTMLTASPGWIPAVILDSAYYRYIESDCSTALSVLASIETAVNGLDL